MNIQRDLVTKYCSHLFCSDLHMQFKEKPNTRQKEMLLANPYFKLVCIAIYLFLVLIINIIVRIKGMFLMFVTILNCLIWL